jgi:hypothetical protein
LQYHYPACCIYRLALKTTDKEKAGFHLVHMLRYKAPAGTDAVEKNYAGSLI